MECKYTCFDRVMNLVKSLPKEKFWDACDLITNYSFIDFLDFCVENECFTESQSTTLYEGIVMWEDLDGNYYEEDEDKLVSLYEKLGLTTNAVREFQDCESMVAEYIVDQGIAKDENEAEEKVQYMCDENILKDFVIRNELVIHFC